MEKRSISVNKSIVYQYWRLTCQRTSKSSNISHKLRSYRQSHIHCCECFATIQFIHLGDWGSEQPSKTSKNMADDLLQGLKDAVDNLDQGEETGSDDPQDRIQQLLKALKDLPGVSDEQKENLAKSVLGGGSQPPLGIPIANPWLEFAVLFGLISFVVLLLGKKYGGL